MNWFFFFFFIINIYVIFMNVLRALMNAYLFGVMLIICNVNSKKQQHSGVTRPTVASHRWRWTFCWPFLLVLFLPFNFLFFTSDYYILNTELVVHLLVIAFNCVLINCLFLLGLAVSPFQSAERASRWYIATDIL